MRQRRFFHTRNRLTRKIWKRKSIFFAPSSASRFRDTGEWRAWEGTTRENALSRILASFPNRRRSRTTYVASRRRKRGASTCCTRQGVPQRRLWQTTPVVVSPGDNGKMVARALIIARRCVVAEISFAGLIMMSRSSDARMMDRAECENDALRIREIAHKWNSTETRGWKMVRNEQLRRLYNETFIVYIERPWRGHISPRLFFTDFERNKLF